MHSTNSTLLRVSSLLNKIEVKRRASMQHQHCPIHTRYRLLCISLFMEYPLLLVMDLDWIYLLEKNSIY